MTVSLDEALAVASRGWAVLPVHAPAEHACTCGRECGRSGKHPRIVAWQKVATSDPATIARWWETWRVLNLGILTGRRSGLIVVDIDPDRGGEDELWALERRHGEVPRTIKALTGGGGRHIGFQSPRARVRSGTDVLGRGIDIRGEGGFVVAPPSVHRSGRRYEWEAGHHPDETDLAPLPEWMRRRLVAKAAPPAPAVTAGCVLVRGRRNSGLTRMAGSLKRAGFDATAIAAALHAQNAACCRPPLPPPEVERIARSAASWPSPPLWLTDPSAFCADPRLSHGARAVLRVLCDHANHEGQCHPGIRRIACLTGYHRNSIGAMRDELIATDRIKADIARSGSLYRLLPFLPSSPHLLGP